MNSTLNVYYRNFYLLNNSYFSAHLSKVITLTAITITLFISINSWLNLNYSNLSYAEETSSLGIDSLSGLLICLTTFIGATMSLSNWSNIRFGLRGFLALVLSLTALLAGVFGATDLILFYVFFEATLPLLFVLIGSHGKDKQIGVLGPLDITRVRATYFIFIYTLAGSLFMLLGFLGLAYALHSTEFFMLDFIIPSYSLQTVVWALISLSFFVKTPLVPFHIWLPLAHAEAPLAGSIALAGVVLKLSLYGFLRIILGFLPEATVFWNPMVFALASFTVVHVGLTTLRIEDTKQTIAYSSVSHMAVALLGVFSNSLEGLLGAYMLSLAHGLVSPALFALLGGVLYDRFHSRAIYNYRGIQGVMPLFTIFLLLFTLANVAIPLSPNFTGEFLCYVGGMDGALYPTLLSTTGIFLTGCYSFWLYGRIVGGHAPRTITSVLPTLPTVDMNPREMTLLSTLLILTLIMGLFPEFVMGNLRYPLSGLLFLP